MQQFLTLSENDRRLTFEQTAIQLGIVTTSVEKDFWVCWTLQTLFAMPGLAPHLTFKGGTSLSKAWGLIDRFSEDIDLTIDRAMLGFGENDSPDQAASNKQLHKRLKQLKAACSAYVAESMLPELSQTIGATLADQPWKLILDENDPDWQTLLFYYPTLFAVLVGRYAQPVIKLEMGARSDPWPRAERSIQPFVAEQFPQLFQTPACVVQALLPERTFWEKAMLLHEETFRPPEKPRKARMARHYYDLYQMIQQGIAARAVANIDLFQQVAAHREVFFAQSWVDYATLQPGALKLLPTNVAEWRQDYIAMQREMFRTPPPDFEEIMAVVEGFEREINGLR